MTDPMTEADLLAYVDDELDMARRIEVEDYLAKHPDTAARVMGDLRTRGALRLLFEAPMPLTSMQTLEAARRLERALTWRGIALRMRRVAAVTLLIGVGWAAHAQVGLSITDSEASPQPPAFVKDALHAHRTALLRAKMDSQLETTQYDPAEISRETGILLPTLPREWQVLDAQVFPSREGHSVEIELAASDLGRASLFAAYVPSFNVIAPTVARDEQTRTVYWQSGQLAYALTGISNERSLERAAIRLTNELH